MGPELVSFRACVRVSTLSNMNTSETRGLIAIKFYLKHYWGGGKAALGFCADQMRSELWFIWQQIAPIGL